MNRRRMDAMSSMATAASVAPRPKALDGIAPELLVELDVREDLRSGREPFSLIMAARQRVPEGGALSVRARIVLLAAEGWTNGAIAESLGIDKHTAGKWRNRFAAARLDGLHDEPRPGRPGRSATTRSPRRSR